MAEKTFSIYIRDEALYARARELERDGKISVRDLCVKAIETAVRINDVNPDWSATLPEVRALLADPTMAQEFAKEDIEYTAQYQPNLVATQAMIDNVRDQGGWVISMSKDGVTDGFWMLFAHPRVLSED